MRTTLNLDDELINKARAYTGIEEKTALVHAGLKALIQREAGRRLIALGGTMPKFKPGRGDGAGYRDADRHLAMG